MTQVKMSYYITRFYWQNNPVITDNNWAFLWFTISKLYIIFYMYKIFFNIIASWKQQCLPSFRNRNVFSLNLHYLNNSSFFFTLRYYVGCVLNLASKVYLTKLPIRALSSLMRQQRGQGDINYTLALFTSGPRFNNIIHIMRIIYQSIKISNFYWCVNVGVTYYSESFPRLRSLKLGSLRGTILTSKCLAFVLLNTFRQIKIKCVYL